ncbi:lasso peptide biosynthesis B2 protein [Nonomuraea sp. NPDC049709]|uniref:lasso peptide biosynthesis B2 protein n=1 Tax=Nonomuraea sp. NPDC049709 TaxID=3154736 RepID=UPI0034245AE9
MRHRRRLRRLWRRLRVRRPPEPLWSGVTAVPPGHHLIVEPDGTTARHRRWWTSPEPVRPLAGAAEDVRRGPGRPPPLCRMRGWRPTWCSGVRVRPPFAAHAWVEAGGVPVGYLAPLITVAPWPATDAPAR